ncbi:MAG: glutaredoxin family protein [Haloferacaceae archaeon]
MAIRHEGALVPTVTIYSREECHLCEEVAATVDRVAADLDVPVTVREVDVDEDPELREAYGERVPYVFVDGTPKFKYRVDEADLRAALAEA